MIKLKKNKDIIWYFKVKDSDKFDILKHRELTFSDELIVKNLILKNGWQTITGREIAKKTDILLNQIFRPYTEKENFWNT